MARERMVTRTVNGYTVDTLVYDRTKQELTHKDFTMDVNFSEDNALALVRKSYETAELSIVDTCNIAKFEQLYGMTEKKFIENAKPVPPRGENGRTRERKVTRTVITYKVHALTYNTLTALMEDFTFTCSVDFDTKNADAYARKHCETATRKIAIVRSFEKVEQLYEMSEKKFMELADKLDPRTVSTTESAE